MNPNVIRTFQGVQNTMRGSLPLATVNALMTTVEQLDTDATSAEEATVHVALLAA